MTPELIAVNMEYIKSLADKQENRHMNRDIVIFDIEEDAVKLTPDQIRLESLLFTGAICPLNGKNAL